MPGAFWAVAFLLLPQNAAHRAAVERELLACRRPPPEQAAACCSCQGSRGPARGTARAGAPAADAAARPCACLEAGARSSSRGDGAAAGCAAPGAAQRNAVQAGAPACGRPEPGDAGTGLDLDAVLQVPTLAAWRLGKNLKRAMSRGWRTAAWQAFAGMCG